MSSCASALLALAVLLSWPVAGAATQTMLETADEWTLRRDRDEIRVYTASVEGSNYRAFRAVTELCTGVEPLIELIRDVDRLPEWVPDTELAELIERSEREQRYYVLSSTPWPVASRDMVYRSRVEDPIDAEIVRISIEGLPEAEPHSEDAVRLESARGGWRLEPRDGRVRAEFVMHAEPGGPVPAFLANRFVVGHPFDTLSALRERFPCDDENDGEG